jgi:hypothetical protein
MMAGVALFMFSSINVGEAKAATDMAEVYEFTFGCPDCSGPDIAYLMYDLTTESYTDFTLFNNHTIGVDYGPVETLEEVAGPRPFIRDAPLPVSSTPMPLPDLLIFGSYDSGYISRSPDTYIEYDFTFSSDIDTDWSLNVTQQTVYGELPGFKPQGGGKAIDKFPLPYSPCNTEIGCWALAPEATVPLGAPEPSVWAELLVGFGLVGAAVRKRGASAGRRFARTHEFELN